MSTMRDQPFPGSGGAYRVVDDALVDESNASDAAPAAKPAAHAKATPAAAKADTPNATAARRGTNQE